MNKITLALGAVLALVNSYSITVTIDRELTDHDTLVFDMVWGETQGGHRGHDFIDDPSHPGVGSRILADEFDDQVLFWLNGTSEGWESAFGFGADRHFSNLRWFENDAVSTKEIAGGFGARFVYGAPIPDGGNSAALLAIGLAGLIAARTARRN